MQILIILLAAAVAAIQTWSPTAGSTRSSSLMVRSVVDGNTIDVATIGRVRLLGVDAPRTGPFAQPARERLAELVLRRWVHLELEGSAGAIRNWRSAYVVRDDGLFVNTVLLREGLARVSTRQALVRIAELERAEAEAQSLRRGIWGAGWRGLGRVILIPPKNENPRYPWPPYLSNTLQSGRSANATNFIIDSTTGRSGFSSSSSRPVR